MFLSSHLFGISNNWIKDEWTGHRSIKSAGETESLDADRSADRFMLIFFGSMPRAVVYSRLYSVLIPVAPSPSRIPTPLSKYSENQSLVKTDAQYQPV